MEDCDAEWSKSNEQYFNQHMPKDLVFLIYVRGIVIGTETRY